MTVIINGSTGITYPDNSTQMASGANATNITAGTLSQSYGGTGTSTGFYSFKNRFINGAMQIAQRSNTSVTVTAGTAVPTASTGYPCVDRWFVYSTGANITVAQVAGSNNTRNNYQITGAASVTAIGIGQRIEQANSYDMAGQTATLSVNMSNSLLTTVTWTASYATTTDTFGTIGTPTKTQIATGTFTVSSTLANYSTQISIPAAATTGIEILFTVGAQTSGTWVIGNAQLEIGSQATSFDVRDFGRELIMCQRYYQKSYNYEVPPGTSISANSGQLVINLFGISDGNGGVMGCSVNLPVYMRTTPSLSYWDAGGNASKCTAQGSGGSPTNNTTMNAVYYDTSRVTFRAYNISANGFSVGYALAAEL
jgi:hypothetical protein